MDNLLMIGIYRRPGCRASVVFRKGNEIIYRITTIMDAPGLVSALRLYGSDLQKDQAEPKFVFEILCAKNRHRVLEIGLFKGIATFFVFEKIKGVVDLCFKWCGSIKELADSIGNFTVM